MENDRLASTYSFGDIILDTKLKDTFVFAINQSTTSDELFKEDTGGVKITFVKALKIEPAKESAIHEYSKRIASQTKIEMSEVYYNQFKNRPRKKFQSKNPLEIKLTIYAF